jgi:hypothetical protein
VENTGDNCGPEEGEGARGSRFPAACWFPGPSVDNDAARGLSILIHQRRQWDRTSAATLPSSPRNDEADVSAQRAPAEAQARLPGPDGDARGPRDPEAPPRKGP